MRIFSRKILAINSAKYYMCKFLVSMLINEKKKKSENRVMIILLLNVFFREWVMQAHELRWKAKAYLYTNTHTHPREGSESMIIYTRASGV